MLCWTPEGLNELFPWLVRSDVICYPASQSFTWDFGNIISLPASLRPFLHSSVLSGTVLVPTLPLMSAVWWCLARLCWCGGLLWGEDRAAATSSLSASLLVSLAKDIEERVKKQCKRRNEEKKARSSTGQRRRRARGCSKRQTMCHLQPVERTTEEKVWPGGFGRPHWSRWEVWGGKSGREEPLHTDLNNPFPIWGRR